MIRIALAAALAVIVIADAAVLPASTGMTATIEPVSALKGDRLPARPKAAGCADAAWPYYPAECVAGRAANHSPRIVAERI